MISKKLFEIKQYDFNPSLLQKFQSNDYVNDHWPLVYILSDEKIKEAYVGETTDAIARMSSHLKSNSKNKLTAVRFITSDKFNKSATLDIESNLIQYLTGDGQFKLLNANIGLANHTYFQKKEIYWDVFKTIWSELRTKGLAKHTLEQINNSDLFKYSPYKALSPEQKSNIIEILKSLLNKNHKTIILEGGAGTGKTILAIYLFKLINSELEDFNFKEFGEDEIKLLKLITELKKLYPKPEVALVIPMSSFRATIKKVFKNIKGLSGNMVLGPAEISNKKYDILIVDESHRLRRRVNLGAYFGAFDIANKKLKLDKHKGHELDWIVKQSGKNILFYDENQSIKPSDVQKEDFDKLKSNKSITIPLQSQFRVDGGNGYVSYVDKLLNCKLSKKDPIFEHKNYEFIIFDSLKKMRDLIQNREREFQLSRLVAGYSWEWVSKKKNAYDIVIGDVKLKWNTVASDWVNSKNAIDEVGCIHTTQGYDLNYTGIIFGNEISYDKSTNSIIIKPENYFDKNGKQSIENPNHLKDFIINIYKTIMLRGIKGTYIYVCDEKLREYFKEHITQYQNENSIKIIEQTKVIPFVNSVPLYDIEVAAGSFSELQSVSDFEWIELPKPYKASDDYFVCRVKGNSMNKVIPNNSLCLFKKDPGGSREGKIVLVEHSKIQDKDFGSGYTVKSYRSEKNIGGESWSHNLIELKPMSDSKDYNSLILKEDETTELKVLGIFICVLGSTI